MRIKKGAIVILSAVFVTAVFAMALFLNEYIGSSIVRESDDGIRTTMQAALQDSSAMDARRESIESSFDNEYFQRADTVSYMLNNLETGENIQQVLNGYKSLLSVDNVILINGEGNTTDFAVNTKTNFKDAAFKPLTDLLNSDAKRTAVEAASGDALYRYYGSVVNSDSVAVIAVNRRELEKVTSGFTGWRSKLGGVIPGKTGYMMVVSGETGEILYHPEERFEGKDISAITRKSFELTEGNTVYSVINGTKCRVSVKETNGDYLLAVVPRSDIYGSISFLDGLVIFVFASFLIIMGIYALGIHEREIEESILSNNGSVPDKKFNKKVFAGILLYVIIGIAATAMVFYYIHTLSLLGSQSLSNKKELLTAEKAIERYDTEAAVFENNADFIVLTKAETVAYIIEGKPELINVQDLYEISGMLGLNSIAVFNSRGNVVVESNGASESPFGDNSSNITKQFSKLLKGIESSMYVSDYDDYSGTVIKHGATVLKNSENVIEGFVTVTYEPRQLEKTRVQGNIENILNSLGKSSKGNYLAILRENGNIVYSTARKMIGLFADEVDLNDDFSGFHSINGEECYADSVTTGKYYIVCSLPTEKILKNVGKNTGAVASFAAFVMFAFALVLSLKAAGESREGADQILEFILPDGSVKRRFSNGGKTNRWREKTPSQKASAAAKAMLLLLCGIVTLLYLFPNTFVSQDSILNYIIDGDWEKGLNIFAVTGALISVSVILVIKQVIDFILELLASNSDARTETICRLAISFLKYITALLCIYYCLAKFGVDTDTLLASAGLLSLIVGLGAQDLIKDILAGLFIIFEEEFKVGDIVTVDDFTGTVREIGIRATKIEDIGQNIKVINNNQISGVLNKTQKYSYAIVDVGIEYSESIEKVEAILEKELPEVKKKLPDIISGPTYKGVVELAESSVVIRVVATCTEGKRIPLTFALNREIKMIFDRNNINIPFNQIVVHKED